MLLLGGCWYCIGSVLVVFGGMWLNEGIYTEMGK